MKFAVVGAGAIGAYVGAALSRAGYPVTLLARGAHLAAMRDHGVRVDEPGGAFAATPTIAGDIRDIEPADVVLLTLKAHQIAAIVDDLPHLFHDRTTVVAMQNGIPWWYFWGTGGPHEGRRIHSVDPGGRIGAAIAAPRVLGCVMYASAEIVAPGVVKHVAGTRFLLGEPVRGTSARAEAIAEALRAAGVEPSVEADIRVDIWTKILGNAAFNPLSALTRATLAELCDDPATAATALTMMREITAVAAQFGMTLRVTPEQRLAGARGVGAHRTSMLQDIAARRPLELDALSGAIVELGALAAVATPLTAHVYGLCKALERSVLAGR